MKENLTQASPSEKSQPNKKLKIATIVLFALSIIGFLISTYFFISAVLTSELGKAILLIVFFVAPIVCLIITISSLIVSFVGWKKLKISKISAIINTCLLIAQIIYIILFFILLK